MTLSEILAIFGIIVSASFGLWGISLALRKRKYPGEISFIKDRSIRLFDEIVGSIGALSLNYKGAPIANNIELVKGHLFNSGSKDISHEMVATPLSAHLPNGYKWLEANIISCSDKLKATVQIESEKKLKFDLGLFRCGEYITFEALSEVPEKLGDTNTDDNEIREISEVITWDHRIMDTKRIKNKYIPAVLLPNNKLMKASKILQHLTMLLVIVLTILFFTSYPILTHHIQYKINIGNSTIFAKIFPKDEGILKVKGVNNDYESTVTTENFIKLKPIPFVKKRSLTMLILASILWGLLIIIFGIFEVNEIRDIYNRRKFSRLLNVSFSLSRAKFYRWINADTKR